MLDLQVKPATLKDWETARRYKYTADFMHKSGVKQASVTLSLGGWSPLDAKIADKFGLITLFAIDNLDSGILMEDDSNFDCILCFEVLEHLMNPLIAMQSMRLLCHDDTSVFISFPHRPSQFWSDQHFHEYDESRFLHLVDCSGFEVVSHEKRTFYHHPLFYFTGFRPFLRLTIGRIRWNLYHLKPSRNTIC
jgi:hypothetical protein